MAFWVKGAGFWVKGVVFRVKCAEFWGKGVGFHPSRGVFWVKDAGFWPEGGVFWSKKSIVSPDGWRHNGSGKLNKGVGMAFYDSPGVRYDSGVLYDSAPAPEPSTKKMNKVKLTLNSYNPDGLVVFANLVKTAMTGNANFATPNPTLTAFGTLITTATTKIATYNSALAAAETALADRDAAVAALRAAFSQLGDYVQNISAGDKVKIESAGMSVRAASTPTAMSQVLNLVLTAGDFPGTLDVAFDPQGAARSYEVQTSPDPMTETSWAFKLSLAKSSGTIPGLTSGSKTWARVRAVGTAGVGPWSDPAAKVVP